jgi:hypothetical protein
MSAAPLFGIFALGWIFSRWLGYEGEISQNLPEEDRFEPQEEYLPPQPVSPDTVGKPLFYIEAVHTGSDGRIVYCLYQLSGGIYEEPVTGEIFDESSYEKVGHIIGDPSGTSFLTESKGGYDFVLDGVEYVNVSIFTKSQAIAKVDEVKDDPLSPEREEERESSPPSRPPTFTPPTVGTGSMNSYRKGGVM